MPINLDFIFIVHGQEAVIGLGARKPVFCFEIQDCRIIRSSVIHVLPFKSQYSMYITRSRRLIQIAITLELFNGKFDPCHRPPDLENRPHLYNTCHLFIRSVLRDYSHTRSIEPKLLVNPSLSLSTKTTTFPLRKE